MKLPVLILFAPLMMAQTGIHPSHSENEAIRLNDGSFSAEGVTLRQLLRVAFHVPETRIAGPRWINDDTFDVGSGLRAVLQTSLIDTFKLKTHMEPRKADVYVLKQIAGAEAKLTTATVSRRVHDGDTHWTGKGLSMSTFAAQLAPALRLPVVNETGLHGRYSVDLTWDPDEPEELIMAVRRQLGLELERGIRQLDFLVVDHAEKLR
jgi:uncharacterized protein (TIGR03435 family)